MDLLLGHSLPQPQSKAQFVYGVCVDTIYYESLSLSYVRKADYVGLSLVNIYDSDRNCDEHHLKIQQSVLISNEIHVSVLAICSLLVTLIQQGLVLRT